MFSNDFTDVAPPEVVKSMRAVAALEKQAAARILRRVGIPFGRLCPGIFSSEIPWNWRPGTRV